MTARWLGQWVLTFVVLALLAMSVAAQLGVAARMATGAGAQPVLARDAAR